MGAALKQIIDETNGSAEDELDREMTEMEAKMKDELMDEVVRSTELQKARTALKDGTCPMPTLEGISEFWTADDHAEAAVVEAVLNNAGHTNPRLKVACFRVPWVISTFCVFCSLTMELQRPIYHPHNTCWGDSAQGMSCDSCGS